METNTKAVDPRAYNQVVGRTTLGSIRLTETRFDMKPEALASDSDTWRKQISAEPVEIITDIEGSRLYGVFAFELTCRYKRKKVLTCAARFFVSFKVDGPFEVAVGELFMQWVGKVMAYPYFRSTVAQLVSQAAIDLPPLPMLSLQPRSVNSAADLDEAPSI